MTTRAEKAGQERADGFVEARPKRQPQPEA